MIKLTLQDYWQSEDDMDAVIKKWIADENAKIPADIRENLRGLFPQIGMSPDEADLIPESVAKYITTHSQAYQKYIRKSRDAQESGKKIPESHFEKEFLIRLQTLYAILEFYASFVESLLAAKAANEIYVDAAEARIGLELLSQQADLQPKTKEDENMLRFITEIEKSLRMFESIVPVDIVRYIGQAGYRIAGDTVAVYHSAESLTALIQLKKQAEEFFYKYGYVHSDKNIFVQKEVL